MRGNMHIKFNKRPCVEYTIFRTKVPSGATATYISSLSETDDQSAIKRH